MCPGWHILSSPWNTWDTCWFYIFTFIILIWETFCSHKNITGVKLIFQIHIWYKRIGPREMRQCIRVLTVYPKKYVHGFVVLCFVVVMQSFIMNSHEVFIHIHQGCYAGTGAIVRLPQCQWSKPDGYGKISQCITTTKHSKAKTVCIFLGIYCILQIDIIHASCSRVNATKHV